MAKLCKIVYVLPICTKRPFGEVRALLGPGKQTCALVKFDLTIEQVEHRIDLFLTELYVLEI